MNNKSSLGVQLIVRSRNQTPKYTHMRKNPEANSSTKNPCRARTKARCNVKLTEEQRISILEILNKDLHFSKDAADVASSESIRKLAKKMNLSPFVVCDWLGITDELNEIIDLASVSSYLTKEQIDSTLEMLMTELGSSENTAKADNSEKSADKMDVAPCPEELPESKGITNDLNKVSACSNQGIRSENSSNVKLSGVQKDSILTMLKKDLHSNKEARKVGSAEHIRKLANKMEVPSMVMREWLGITDNLIQVIAESHVKVPGFECQTELLEEVAAAQKEDACPEKILEIEGGFKVIAENYQEPEEELTPKLAPPIPADEEEIMESSKKITEDDQKSLSTGKIEVPANDFDENAPQSIHDERTEEMQEYLQVSSVYEDGNALERKMLMTTVRNKPAELEVDSLSPKDELEAPPPHARPLALRSSSEPRVVVKRKTRIDDYFPALKIMKMKKA